MLQQLLWAEVILKGSLGLLFALAPGYAARAAGLPLDTSGFWPKLVGAGLLGVGAALLLQGYYPAVRTISPAGLIVLNLFGAVMLGTLQILGLGATARRGKLLIWGIAAVLALIGLIEVSFV
jgi:hypothetical protein